jgi:hypothetical protein
MPANRWAGRSAVRGLHLQRLDKNLGLPRVHHHWPRAGWPSCSTPARSRSWTRT